VRDANILRRPRVDAPPSIDIDPLPDGIVSWLNTEIMTTGHDLEQCVMVLRRHLVEDPTFAPQRSELILWLVRRECH